ncbi:hypothetical protein SAMN04488057_102147 [Cyclobacterium lianum]|uniref:CarboxypepD_reg-like domain-containing protein n=1 Tax=Cyclobacterium lianum TaxID=388280 RepID=A0A1M7JTL6_9BACT|nr:carboxypeptidase-like regulatory domain-containing protein [Cyclobacterium lianum]SHM56073.1 hypothetical protein SAMN04488057_102147 [Cyclobacterium lianum]
MRVIIFFALFLILSGLVCNRDLQAQGYLLSELDISYSSEPLLGEVFEQISSQRDFYFSYQSDLIDLDARLPLRQYNGTLEGFLYEVLGNAYVFSEHEGYLIIRYAPGQLDVALEVDLNGKVPVLRGQIIDLNSGKSIPDASIIEKSGLAYTMSDSRGFFELRLKPASATSTWLTLRKENYRDTSFVLLPSVEVDPDKPGWAEFRFLPSGETGDNLENSFWGGLFIGFRQRMQRLNLAGFFAESPVQISLTPGLSTQGIFSSQMINNFSLNLLGGYTAGVEGIEAAGLFNLNQRMVSGMQTAGLFNLVGGGVSGFQAAGIFNNVYGRLSGFQVAGLVNLLGADLDGAQVAGLINRVSGKAPVQVAGWANIAQSSDRVQVAGLYNLTKADAGIAQIAGLANRSGGGVSYQIAGLINRADTVTRLQLGLINVASSSDYPMGLINIIGDGEQSIALGMDETSFSRLSLRTGGRKMYGLIATGILLQSPPEYGLELGLGIHLMRKMRYSMDLEIVERILINSPHRLSSLRFLQGYKQGKHLKFFAGPSLGLHGGDTNNEVFRQGVQLIKWNRNSQTHSIQLGVAGGIQWVF